MTWSRNRRFAQSNINRIHRQSSREQPSLVKGMIRSHLHRFEVKCDAAERSLIQFEGGGLLYPDQARVEELANEMDLFKPCATPILWRYEPKSNGEGFRIVYSLPRVWKAQHKIIRDVLGATLQPGPHLIDIRRRGRDYVASRIRAVLEQGYDYCFVGDLRNCFGSVNPEGLYTLPLPHSVIHAMLDSRNMYFTKMRGARTSASRRTGSNGSALSSNGSIGSGSQPWRRQMDRSGLVTGSPTSNLVLSYLFNDMPTVLSPGCPAFIQADDVFAAAKTAQEARSVENALAGYFSAHPAGPFSFGKSLVVSAFEGFEYLGYHFQKQSNGEVRIEMSKSNAQDAFVSFLAELNTEYERGRPFPGESERFLRAKFGGFASADDIEDFLHDQVEYAQLHLSHESWAMVELVQAWQDRFPGLLAGDGPD